MDIVVTIDLLATLEKSDTATTVARWLSLEACLCLSSSSKTLPVLRFGNCDKDRLEQYTEQEGLSKLEKW